MELNTLGIFRKLIHSTHKSSQELENSFCEMIYAEFEGAGTVLYEIVNSKLVIIGKYGFDDPEFALGAIHTPADNLPLTTGGGYVFKNVGELSYNDNNPDSVNIKFDSMNKSFVLRVISENSFDEESQSKVKEYLKIFSEFNTLRTGYLFQQRKIVNSSEKLFGTINKKVNNILLNEKKYASIEDESLKQLFADSVEISNNISDYIQLYSNQANKLQRNNDTIILKDFLSSIKQILLNLDGVNFDYSFSEDLKGKVITDKEKLLYVIKNLSRLITSIDNNKDVTLEVKQTKKGKLKFVLKNNNTGIKENLSELLKPFFIEKISNIKNSKASGLSLILSNTYIKFLGGSFKINKLQNNSIAFEFTITGEVMSADIQNTFSKLPKPDSNHNSILVIEDDFTTSRLLNKYLQEWGYAPTIVNTAHQAFESVKSKKYLAIILNIEIPNYNGLELLKELKEMPENKGVPVIVFSVEPEEQKAFMMGAVEYFVKPVNYNYLVEVLTNYKLKRNSNILCVDDDPPALNLVKNAIEQAGYIALAHSESWKVIENIRGKEIDLAIVDLDMPRLNGFELIKEIKSLDEFKKLPIIIYTGKENFEEDLKNIDGLFENLLSKKSTGIDQLRDSINSMLNRYDTPPPVEEVIQKQDVTKIILAEDYKHSQIIVTRLLKKNGFENIVVVDNGQKAVEMAQQEQFSLILMDMQMPIMNGFDATKAIRQMPGYENTPIIALTAFAMKGDREKCIDAGATDYIPKPIDSKEFIEKVKHYTGKE